MTIWAISSVAGGLALLAGIVYAIWGGTAHTALTVLGLERVDERRELALYWIFFPPFETRAAARERVADLKAKGVEDIFTINRGDMANAVAAARRGLYALRMDGAEAEGLAGRALDTVEDTAEFAARLVAGEVAEVVQVARGAEGTVIAQRTGVWHCAPPVVEVVSAVGAGDAHVAGFVLGLSQGLDPVSACIQGVGAAASAVGTPDTALCEQEGAAEFAKGVVVRRL